ncbi:MAG: hypothetical protein ACKOJB_07315, partial [Chthoniobacterales bacterium]
DGYEVASARARLQRVSLGKAVSDMARRSLGAVRREEDQRGCPVLRAPAGSPRITTERVSQLMDEMEADEAGRAGGR